MAMSVLKQKWTQNQQQGPTQLGLGTSINDQPNYDIGMTVDPGLGDAAKSAYQGLMNDPRSRVGRASAAGGQATTQEVNDNQLMSHQLNQLLAQDSPYIDQARRGAMETHAGRGMLNSSMAAGAGERQAIQAGMPIAGFDASRYGSVADQNMSAQNAMEMANLQSRTQLAGANLQAQVAQRGQNQGLQGMYLGHQLGALDDYRRHMLGMETREDTQAFGAGQNEIDRYLNDKQFGAGMGLDYSRLGEGARQADQQMWGNTQAGLMQIANSIFSNPNLSADQQAAAWNNAVNQVAPSIGQGAMAMIPPHLINQIAGPNASNAVARMPPVRMRRGG